MARAALHPSAVKKWILIGVVLAALGVAGVVTAFWYHEQTETKVVRGSSSIEFVTTEEPATETRPKRTIRKRPWPMFGYQPARTHVAVDFRHRPPFRQRWGVETGAYIEFPPAVANRRLFVANQKGHFLAIGTERGRVLWRKHWRHCIASGPAIGFGLVYQTVMNPYPCRLSSGRERARGFTVAMDQRTGRVRWRFDAGAMESSPLLVRRTLYVTSWDRRVYALNALTGKRRWAFDTGAEVDGSVAYANGTVFVGTNGGQMFALDARTGRQRWRATSFARFGSREHFYSTPAVAYGRVYAGNTDGTLYAFGARSGRLLWARPAGTYIYGAPAVWRNRVFVGTYDGYMNAFDAATGERVWRWAAPSAVHGTPTVMAGIVYFSSAYGVATGKAKRYVKNGPRGTFGLDARTGKLVWSRPGQGQYSPIVADEERVYLVGSTRVYGMDPKRKRKARRGGGSRGTQSTTVTAASR